MNPGSPVEGPDFMVPLPSMISLSQAKNAVHSVFIGILGAAVFDAKTYAKVSSEKSTGALAILILLITSCARGIGQIGSGELSWIGFIEGFFLSIIWWVVFTFSGYIMSFLFTLKPLDRSRQTEIARLTSFAQAPGILWVFGVIPNIGIALTNTAVVWQMATTTVAIKHSLKDQTHWRAIASTVAGFLLWLAVMNIFKS